MHITILDDYVDTLRTVACFGKLDDRVAPFAALIQS